MLQVAVLADFLFLFFLSFTRTKKRHSQPKNPSRAHRPLEPLLDASPTTAAHNPLARTFVRPPLFPNHRLLSTGALKAPLRKP